MRPSTIAGGLGLRGAVAGAAARRRPVRGRAGPRDYDDVGGDVVGPRPSTSSSPKRVHLAYYRTEPVFRASTLVAERRRRHLEDEEARAKKLNILFVEEGGEQVRSKLALDIFKRSLDSDLAQRVDCDCAAILPHCSYSWEESIRAFDDVNDAVESDLIVVMDRFDHAEVLKEVAAYDNIFPGGHYALKVRRLAGFKTCNDSHCAVPWAGDDANGLATSGQDPHDLDISDPLYFSPEFASSATESSWDEWASARDAALLEEVMAACQGLVRYVEQIREMADLREHSLGKALLVNLLANDLAIGEEGLFARNTSILRSLSAKRKQTKSKGYWMDMENVKRELTQWAKKHDHAEGVMPIVQDIRKTGDYMIFHSITKYHGGKGSVAKQLGWTIDKRVGRGHWHDKENIYRALWPYLDCQGSGGEDCLIPTKSSLVEQGRQDLVGAIDRLGGFKALASDLNLKMSHPGRKPLYPDLKDWEPYKQRLESWAVSQSLLVISGGEALRRPRMNDMAARGAKDLHYATKKYHGGLKRVSERMGWLKPSEKKETSAV